MPPPMKRNGVVNWIMGIVMVSGLLGILGIAFSNQRVLAEHQQAERAHPVISGQLEAIAKDVAYIRRQFDDIHRRIEGTP